MRATVCRTSSRLMARAVDSATWSRAVEIQASSRWAMYNWALAMAIADWVAKALTISMSSAEKLPATWSMPR